VTGVTGGEGSMRQALGRRTGPDGTTWFFDLGADAGGPLASLVPGLAGSGRVVAELSPGVLVLRRSGPGPQDRQVTERVATLPLGAADDREAVRKFLLEQTVGPLAYKAGLDLARRVEARGRVEVSTYAEDTDSDKIGATLLAAGVDHTHTVRTRKLVDQYVDGPIRSRRADCLGI
jgi:hypothetical protein